MPRPSARYAAGCELAVGAERCLFGKHFDSIDEARDYIAWGVRAGQHAFRIVDETGREIESHAAALRVIDGGKGGNSAAS